MKRVNIEKEQLQMNASVAFCLLDVQISHCLPWLVERPATIMTKLQAFLVCVP